MAGLKSEPISTDVRHDPKGIPDLAALDPAVVQSVPPGGTPTADRKPHSATRRPTRRPSRLTRLADPWAKAPWRAWRGWHCHPDQAL